MELYPVQFSKALLDAVPEDERTFHLMAGQLANDLNILTKLLTFAMNPIGGHEVLNRANTSIAMLMIKQLAGRLNEGWVMIRDQFSPLHKKYENDLSDTAKQSRDRLNKYFGRTNLVNLLRKKAGFHLDPELAKKGYECFPEGEIFVDFLSEYRGHCFYYSSEIVAVMGMTQLVPDVKWQEAIDQIARETTSVTNWMTDFILGFMQAFMVKYVVHAIGDITVDKITIENGPPIDTVIIPFFPDPPGNPHRDDESA